jgi:preprotein translocase subunit YajC
MEVIAGGLNCEILSIENTEIVVRVPNGETDTININEIDKF